MEGHESSRKVRHSRGNKSRTICICFKLVPSRSVGVQTKVTQHSTKDFGNLNPTELKDIRFWNKDFILYKYMV